MVSFTSLFIATHRFGNTLFNNTFATHNLQHTSTNTSTIKMVLEESDTKWNIQQCKSTRISPELLTNTFIETMMVLIFFIHWVLVTLKSNKLYLCCQWQWITVVLHYLPMSYLHTHTEDWEPLPSVTSLTLEQFYH